MKTNAQFYRSLDAHQIGPKNGFGLAGTLLSSHNQNLEYPCAGLLYIIEQGVDLHISQAVFHRRNPDGSLGAPCVVKNPTFVYMPRSAP